jgi:pyruvate dehydrogenase E2 component (dihydrolipoamide acetyltransferase)
MDVKVPALGEGADSGTVVNVLVSEGEDVQKDQIVLELENEKAVASIPATAGGKVTKVHVKPGDRLAVGDVILSLSAVAPAEQRTSEAAAPARAEVAKPPQADQQERAAPNRKVPPRSTAVAHGLPAPASPAIRRLARDLGIDLARVDGTESGGRIGMADLRNYIAELQRLADKTDKIRAAPAAPDFSKWGSVLKQPISSLRKAISAKMVQSWTTVPHVTQFDEADITNLLTEKKRQDAIYKEKGVRLTLTTFLIKAVVRMLQEHRLFNASLDESSGEIVFKEYYHIGIAVDTEHGLVVPVVRDADRKDLAELSREVEELAAKARNRKLNAEEMKGGSFTISNQGGIGGGHFTPIINVPEVAILGVGRAAKRPQLRDGKIEERMVVPLCLSYDHRVIDGGSAARFTRELVEALEHFSENGTDQH